jgi:subtilisin family serine protease
MTHNRLLRTFFIVLLVAVAISTSVPSFAQGGLTAQRVTDGQPSTASLAAARAGLVPASYEEAQPFHRSGAKVHDLTNAARTPDGRVRVIMHMSGTPALARTGFRVSASMALNSVRAEQQSAVTAARALGAQYLGAVQYVGNYVFMALPEAQVKDLAAVAGVSEVWPDVIFYRDDAVSVPMIGAANAWAGGLTGIGRTIAIVDTGIDYTHRHFGGNGDFASVPDRNSLTGVPAGLFPANPANVGTVPGAPKVVGGYDFVGDSYNASGTGDQLTPKPDPNPIDCPITEGGGHGTHVAGTAGGYGTTEPSGLVYPGPYNSGTAALFPSLPNWSPAWRIGPGVAPQARLLAMKVFGCNGSTASINPIMAIEASVLGTYSGGLRADVINQSLGSAYGTSSPTAPYSVAVANAATAGTVTVMSAGNSGDLFYVTGAPGSAPAGIAVASTLDTNNRARAVRRNTGTGAPVTYGAQYAAFGPFIHTAVTATAAQPAGTLGPTAGTTVVMGCDPQNFTGFTPGNIALVLRGVCSFFVKANNAFAAGASGLIVYNDTRADQSLVSMAGDPGLNPAYNIPSVFVNNADGVTLISQNVTIDWTLSKDVAEAKDTPSGFTSRGPSRGNFGLLKPDIAGPGNTILSAGSGTGAFTYNISGTSMASPHVAGVLALLRQANPGWTVQELKALALNTARVDVKNAAGTLTFPPQRVGTGRVDVDAALASKVIAYNGVAPENVSINFGMPEVRQGKGFKQSRPVTLKNKGTTTATYDVQILQRSDMPGVTFSTSAPTVTVPAGGTATLFVSITASVSSNAITDPTLSPTSGATRFWFPEESALLNFAPTSGATVPLRVALYSNPRAISDITAPDTVNVVQNANSATSIALPGLGVSTGAPSANNINSLTGGFELVFSKPASPAILDDVDVRYLGIANDILSGGGRVFFAIATEGNWGTPRQTLFTLYIDSNQDGLYDWAVQNRPDAANADRFRVGVIDLRNAVGGGAGALYLRDNLNAINFSSFPTYHWNSNVMVIGFESALFSSLVTPADTSPAFNYALFADTFDNPADDAYEIIPDEAPLTYNPTTVRFYFNDLAGSFGGPYTGAPYWSDGGLFAIPVDSRLAGVTGALPQIMLVHFHNRNGARVKLVTPVLVAGPESPAVQAPESAPTFIPPKR